MGGSWVFKRYKNIEDYLMCIDNYAYDPCKSGGAVYIRVVHRFIQEYIFIAKVEQSAAGLRIVPISTTMPESCIREFADDLRRNLELLVRCWPNDG